MKKPKVLLATDGSEPALRAAEQLVAMVTVPIQARVFTVLSYSYYPDSLYAGADLSDEESRALTAADAVEEATRDARLILEKAGIDVDVGYRFGNAGDEILTEIDEWRPDLLVMGRRGVRGLARLMGSVSDHVVRHARVPVLLVP